MNRLAVSTAIMAVTALGHSTNINKVNFHNEATDTTTITRLLQDAAVAGQQPGSRVAGIGREFIGTAYRSGTLEGESEMLQVNLDEMDCTTYVETVMALAYTIGENRHSWRDFLYNLERLRYRGGEMSDYASRLHYISDWVVDNVRRGNFIEVTSQIPSSDYTDKTIDFMSSHRDKYPALADSLQFVKIKNTESGYRNHRFPYIKKERLANKAVMAALKDGDVVALTSKIAGLDVSHMGIIVKENGIPYLMHASSAAGSVVIDRLPLAEYMRRNKNLSGIRVFRLID
ncbi:MAG: DUF1460 domain-containing protein [Muribaculaceae bacterium]|nr:DUF1460 domain-containing protein [Muribaculaceae bacterium]